MTTHICGAGMAFLGFSLSLLIGLWVDNPFTTVVFRSLLIMFLFYLLGCLLASLGGRVIVENYESEKELLSNNGDKDTSHQQSMPSETNRTETPVSQPNPAT